MGEALGSHWFEDEPEIDGLNIHGLENGAWTIFGGEYDSSRITVSSDRLGKISREAMAYPDSARSKKMALELVGYAVELSDPRLHLDEERAEVVKEKVISAVVQAAKFSRHQLTTEIRELASELEEHDTPTREALRDVISAYNHLYDGEELDIDTVILSQGTLSILAINERGVSDELPEPNRY